MGGITSRISPESSLVHFNNGRSNGKHREGSTLGDDVRYVLYAMTRKEVEEDLETWRVVFERHGLKTSRTKTEYLPSPQMIQKPQ